MLHIGICWGVLRKGVTWGSSYDSFCVGGYFGGSSVLPRLQYLPQNLLGGQGRTLQVVHAGGVVCDSNRRDYRQGEDRCVYVIP